MLWFQFTPCKKKNPEFIRDHFQAQSLKNGLLSAEVDKVTLDQYVHSLGALPKFAKMVNMWSQVMHGLESTEESAAWFIDYCRRNKGFLAIRADDSTGGQYLRFQDGSSIYRYLRKNELAFIRKEHSQLLGKLQD